MDWNEIPQFPRASHAVDVGWQYLETYLDNELEAGLSLDPDFQRAHVWTPAQRRYYIEYCMQGGEIGRNITLTCRSWNSGYRLQDYSICDGKQRVETVRRFMRGEIGIFPDADKPEGYHFGDFTGKFRWAIHSLRFQVVECRTKADILSLYLKINAGGTPHTQAELNKVRKMLEAERAR